MAKFFVAVATILSENMDRNVFVLTAISIHTFAHTVLTKCHRSTKDISHSCTHNKSQKYLSISEKTLLQLSFPSSSLKQSYSHHME